MRLDHVIYGARDLEHTAARLEQQHGLRFLRGGRHPGGTVNSVCGRPGLHAVGIAGPNGEIVLRDDA